MINAIAIVLVLVVGTLAGITAIGSRRIEAAEPPSGRFARVEGLDVHYVDERPSGGESAPPVVFIHGASSTLEEPRSVFAGRLPGRRVIYVDRPGHGHSARGPAEMASPSAQARVIAGLLDAIGVERAVIVCHSFGCAVGAAFGVLFPEKVVGHVFLAPATHPWPGGVAWYYGLSTTPIAGEAFARTLVLPVGWATLDAAVAGVFAPNPVPPGYVETARIPLVLRPENFLANAADVAGLKEAVTAMAPRYSEITAPTVIVTGDSDGVVWPSIHSEGLRRAIAGSELVVLEGVGHMPHHVRPDVVIAAIDRVGRTARVDAE